MRTACIGFVAFVSLFTLIAFSEARGETESGFKATYSPELHIQRMEGSISVEGELSDSGWQKAGKAANFCEHRPGDQTEPPVKTEALITYDADHLYVAFVCYDDPLLVRATMCERDGPIGGDDNICLLIDTYGDASWAYELNVNPYGVQADAIWSPYGGEDSRYDLIWESAGKITDSGYQLEMAIPFSSLRFPNKDVQTWKMDFWRNHPREIRRQYSWAALNRAEPCWPCQWGTVTGIENVQPGKGIEIMPTVVGYQAGALENFDNPDAAFVNDDADGELSMGVKYGITSNITAEATYNPDFSQVEADAGQIDVNTTFALFYPERRPFFQEGDDLFRTIFDAVYTRTINDPIFAAKTTARVNRTSVAYLAARDDNSPMIIPFEENSQYLMTGKSTSNILRVRRSFGDDSHLGFIMTDRRLEGGGSGTFMGVDGRQRLSQMYRLEWQAVATHSEEPDDWALSEDFAVDVVTDDITGDTISVDTLRFDDGKHTVALDGESFWGHAFYAGVTRESANSYLDLCYYEKSPTYRADNGYQPRNDMQILRGMGQYVFRLEDNFFSNVTPSFEAATEWNSSGERKVRYMTLGLSGDMHFAGISYHALYRVWDEMWGGVQFDGLYRLHMCASGRPSGLVSFDAAINYGHEIDRADLAVGKELNYSLGMDVKPWDRFLIETYFVHYESKALDTDEELYRQSITWARARYQLTRHLSLRVVGEYNDRYESFHIDPMVTFRLNPFSIFYVGTTYNYAKIYDGDGEEPSMDPRTRLDSRQFFMKLQYLFQI